MHAGGLIHTHFTVWGHLERPENVSHIQSCISSHLKKVTSWDVLTLVKDMPHAWYNKTLAGAKTPCSSCSTESEVWPSVQSMHFVWECVPTRPATAAAATLCNMCESVFWHAPSNILTSAAAALNLIVCRSCKNVWECDLKRSLKHSNSSSCCTQSGSRLYVQIMQHAWERILKRSLKHSNSSCCIPQPDSEPCVRQMPYVCYNLPSKWLKPSDISSCIRETESRFCKPWMPHAWKSALKRLLKTATCVRECSEALSEGLKQQQIQISSKTQVLCARYATPVTSYTQTLLVQTHAHHF